MVNKQLAIVQCLFESLMENFKIHVLNNSMNEHWGNGNYMNKNCGKVALKRKITLIRQELLNLEQMLNTENY